MKIEVKKNILASNSSLADRNRELLEKNRVCMVNMMASPGAGKTSVIMKALESITDKLSLAVIEGDIASEIDSLAIEAMDVTALQINTGGACHLTAAMIGSALEHLDLGALDMVIIENVGNLVCPVEFDLGETSKVMIASVAEGDDKPHKYPLIFKEVDAILINKIDLLPYCDFDMDAFRRVVGELNPNVDIMEISCSNGQGINSWGSWLESTAALVS